MSIEQDWQYARKELSRRELGQLFAGAAAGATVGAPVASELLHIANTEITKEVRNKKPNLLTYVPDSSVAFGYWPHENDYFAYRKQFGVSGHLIGTFVPNNFQVDTHPRLIREMINIQVDGKLLTVSFGWSVKDPKRHIECRQMARNLKNLPYLFWCRPNIEANKHRMKKLYEIDNPEELKIWWEEMYTIFMEEEVNCKFVFCANTTEDILTTDPIEPYIPEVGVDIVAFDTYDRYSDNPYEIKHILPECDPYQQVGHDIAVIQEKLLGIPYGFAEFGSEQNPEFKPKLLEIAPYLGVQFAMSFEWKKDDLEKPDPDEVDWRSIKSIQEHRSMIQAIRSPEYIPDEANYSFS